MQLYEDEPPKSCSGKREKSENKRKKKNVAIMLILPWLQPFTHACCHASPVVGGVGAQNLVVVVARGLHASRQVGIAEGCECQGECGLRAV